MPVAMRINVNVDGAMRKLDKRVFDNARLVALHASADVMERYQQQAAVDLIYGKPQGRYKRTGGYLRSLVKRGKYHIRKRFSANAIVVGSSIPHAVHLEYGTMYMTARHVIQEAADRGTGACLAMYESVFRAHLHAGTVFGATATMVEYTGEDE